jgi:hypothetical protein
MAQDKLYAAAEQNSLAPSFDGKDTNAISRQHCAAQRLLCSGAPVSSRGSCAPHDQETPASCECTV